MAGRIVELLRQVKELAVEYYDLTGKPLGVTGEIAEVEAADKLKLKLCSARNDGYDAVRQSGNGPRRIQIKGRRLLKTSSPSQRLGSIKLEKEWDSVLFVVLDCNYSAVAMYEADRADVAREILKPGSRARNERGALSATKFMSISRCVWEKQGVEKD